MSDIRPFRGLRPRADLVAQVAAPPYDVLSSDEARAMAAGNPISFLRVSKAEVDFGPEVDVHGDAIYARSAQNFQRLIAEGVLVRDPAPAYYVYELTMGRHVQRGLMAACSVAEYENGQIKKHELTRRDKEDDRARHTATLRANAGPVLFTYRARPGIRALIADVCGAAPAVDFTAGDGIRHRLWVVDATATVNALTQAFAAVDALYVADGHHRSASAFRVRNLMREQNPHHTGHEAYNYFMAVMFPDDELQILGYNRVVKDLNGHEPAAFLAAVAEKFVCTPTTEPAPQVPRQFGMVLDGQWYRLTARPGSFPADDPVRGLDVAILQDNLLAPLLGVADPRTDKRIDFVGGIRGTAELERRCKLDSRVAFALYPVSVAELMAIADSGAIMPPKSTWFEPKLRSGVVVRSLDEAN